MRFILTFSFKHILNFDHVYPTDSPFLCPLSISLPVPFSDSLTSAFMCTLTSNPEFTNEIKYVTLRFLSLTYFI